jgi:hypothetical protein
MISQYYMPYKKIAACTLALVCLGIMIPRANAHASISLDGLLKQIQSLKQQVEQMALAIQNLKNQQDPICARTLDPAPSAAEIAECANASGAISCADNKCSCSCPGPVGGNCTYAAFEGKCKVLSVADNDGASPTVRYLFTPAKTLTDADMSSTFLAPAAANAYEGQTAASYLGLLCLKGSFDPTAEIAKQCGIVENAEFTCTLSVAKTGTCTPVNVKFADQPCANGDTREFTCADNETVEWCKCSEGKWACNGAPEKKCGKACAPTNSLVYKNGNTGPARCCSKNDGIKSTSFLANGRCTAAADGSAGACVSEWWKTCGDAKCDEATENICNCAQDCGDNIEIGKAACNDTGGSWIWSHCAPGCQAKNKTERLKNHGLNCAAVCVRNYVCKCPGGMYWASKTEGCLSKNNGDTDGNNDG